MWLPIMAGVSLVAVLGSVLMGAFGNPQQRQQGLQNQAQYIEAGIGGNSGRPTRGVPPRSTTTQQRRR